jgi:ankyrin repeat protein
MSRPQIVIDDRDDGGNTHLMRAALEGQTETVKALLRKGADVNAQNREGRTALMFAVINLRTATVKTLLSFGADVNVQANCGCTPLMLAACSGDIGITRALLNLGADAGKTCWPGRTALVVAVERGYSAIVEVLKRAMGQSTQVKAESVSSDIARWRSIHLSWLASDRRLPIPYSSSKHR